MYKFNCTGKFMQGLLAVISGITLSTIYLYFINEYCITILEATIPNRADYFSEIARFPIALPITVFSIINLIIFLVSRKRYKIYAFSYLSLTVSITLGSLLFIKTYIVRGV